MKFRIGQKQTALPGCITYDPVIIIEGKRLVLDGNIPQSVARHIPHACGNAKREDWIPCVQNAIAKGLI